MKYRNILLLILLTSLLSSCITATYIEISVLEPAEIDLPNDVGTLGIIDRSVFNPPDTLLAQKIGEEPDEERFKDMEVVAEESMNGLATILDDSPRFYQKILKSIELEIDDFSDEPDILEWEQILNLCIEEEVDAMVVLRRVDSYDPYFLVSESTFSYNFVYFTFILNSWRIYDPFNMQILDEFEYVDTTYQEVKENLLEIFLSSGSPDREYEVKRASYWAGALYGTRITPNWEDVDRQFYRWGNDQSQKAAIFIENDNWPEAATLWNKETESKKKKIAAKACYNMALASEVMDNIELAIYWAERSQSVQINKDTQLYLVTLRNRLADIRKLNIQMNYE